MRFLSVEQMRAADRAAVGESGIPEIVLMNRAGAALARCVAHCARLRGLGRVILVAGHGNNGGDACVAARCLHADGFKAQLIMTTLPEALKGAALTAWEAMRDAGVPFETAATEDEWSESGGLGAGALLNCGIVVDGVLGTGCSGAPRGAAAAAIRCINRLRPHALVIAADIPSGMNGDTGAVAGDGVRADVTVTFAAPKQGFLNREAMPLLGHLVVADIGIPDEVAFRHVAPLPCQLIALPEIARFCCERRWDSHKGGYGHLCVIGGAPPYPNAAVLCAAGALRGGAGLVTLRSCAQRSECALSLVPEAIAETLALDDFFAADAARRGQLCSLKEYTTVVAGPGLGRSEGATALVRHLIEHTSGRLVLDADALNALSALTAEGYAMHGRGELFLTPHPGEAARLLECTVADVQTDRIASARELARRFNAVVLLKGAGTLVCDAESPLWLNLTGNPGMATGGTGDVLAGVLGGLLAQGLEGMQAAVTAVWAHGCAGDWAAMRGSQRSLTAWDLVQTLPSVFQAIGR